MNKKHRKTLAAIFSSPIPRNIAYRDMAALLTALQCEIEQAEGSRVIFNFGRYSFHIHEPHPGKEIKQYQVKAVREFLNEIGVKP